MIRSIFKYFPVLLIVVLFYGLVMIPGTFHRQVETRAQPVNESLCVMAFETGDFAVPEIITWADLNNPTLFALPDYRRGFSAVMEYRLPPVHSPIPDIPLTGASGSFPDMLAAPFTPVRLKIPRLEAEVVGVKRKGEGVDGTVIAPKTMLWMWGNGTMIETPPSIAGWLKEMDFSKLNPTAETQVDIINEEGTLRMLLDQSSGSRELDQAVLQALGPGLSVAEMPNQEVTPRFLGKELPVGRARVRVEWRTLPELNGEER